MSVWKKAKTISDSLQIKTARDTFGPVVTPESIPQFTIPPLAIQDNHRVFPTKKSTAWRSHQWHSMEEGMWDRKARRSCSDPLNKQECSQFSRVNDLPDPGTRAAMSLPHLAKVTTPYGFVTLGESPQVTSKESVFFQSGTCLHKGILMNRSSSFNDTWPTKDKGISDIYKGQNHSRKSKEQNRSAESIYHVERTLLIDPTLSANGFVLGKFQSSKRLFLRRRRSVPLSNIIQDKKVLSDKEWSPPVVCHRSNSLPKTATKVPYGNLFQNILKRHFSNLKLSKPLNSESVAKKQF